MIPASRRSVAPAATLLAVLLLPLGAASRPPLADGGLTLGEGQLSEGLDRPGSGLGIDVLCDGNNYGNDNYLDPVLMGGPMIAISWTPTVTSTVTRIELLTGEVTASNFLGLWSDDGGSPAAPLAPLGFSGAFVVDPPVAWVGADLNVGVPVVAGGSYWVVWDPVGGEQASCTDDPADIQQTYYGSNTGTVSGGAGWELGPFSFPDRRWKFRVYCEEAGGGDDEDGDGVLDEDDLCPGTVLPELAPEVRLGVNRFALVDDDGVFDTTEPNGRGPQVEFTIEDTRGCSCEQIIEALGIGEGHEKFGCSLGVMRRWMALIGP